MKKERASFILIVIILLLLASPFILAQNGDSDDSDDSSEQNKVDQAYECLGEKIENQGCGSLSVEEQAFSVLATGDCEAELKSGSSNNECWPSSGCRLKDTALAILALERVGENTEDAEDWLLSKKENPDDLIWYLEIDSNEETQCTINYGSTEKKITIKEDKKISSSAGSCLSLAQGNYWLKIKDTCYETNFSVSCDENFVSTLLYTKKTGSTIYVSSETKSAPAEGTTKHQVNAFCFSLGGECNYEGSLWATVALAKTGHDISQFLPYLIAMADETENKKYFPAAFLYMLTDYDEYFSEIIEEQKSSGYWQVSTDSNKKFYDTALAMLALYGLDAEQLELGKSWLLEVQGDNGCWRNNIRDTAFILFAVWQRSVSSGTGSSDIEYCEDYNYFCVAPEECSEDDTLDSFYCSGLSAICCRIEPLEQTCDEKGGIICQEDEECTGSLVTASDSNYCCLESCVEISDTTECEDSGYSCRYDCFDDEEEKPYDCGDIKVCCGSESGAGSSWWIWLLIILLIILIALVVLAIIYRNQVKVWLFKVKNKFKKGPSPGQTRPGPKFPPSPVATRGQGPRMFVPRQPAPRPRGPGIIKRAVSKTDKELEETLKKLKEMSK